VVFTDTSLIEKLTMVLADVSSGPPAKTDSHDRLSSSAFLLPVYIPEQ
jgi:hypothetical protein